MTDATQTVVWQGDYNPFGEATLVTSTVTNNIRFPGQYFDAESGLHYNYFRDYNPNDGRYMQSDPIGVYGGMNTYAYAASNPTINSDPFGLFDIDEEFENAMNQVEGDLSDLNNIRVRTRSDQVEQPTRICFEQCIFDRVNETIVGDILFGLVDKNSDKLGGSIAKKFVKNVNRYSDVVSLIQISQCKKQCEEATGQCLAQPLEKFFDSQVNKVDGFGNLIE